MATSSTNKKIQRVQQSGVTRRTGQRRPMAFGAAVVAIVVVGIVLVLLARDARINVGGDKPRANQDKWYEAYGFYLCDDYQPNPARPAEDTDISTLGNGVISIFPLSAETAGDNATFDKYFDALGMKVTDTSVTLPDGTVHKAGDACGAGDKKTTKTVLKLFVWPPQASDKTKPEVVTGDFSSVRFDQDRGAYALALVPESTDKIDLPPSVTNLTNPEASATPAPGASTTVPADGASTTVPADGATTTVPADGATTTVPATTAAPTTTAG